MINSRFHLPLNEAGGGGVLTSPRMSVRVSFQERSRKPRVVFFQIANTHPSRGVDVPFRVIEL